MSKDSLIKKGELLAPVGNFEMLVAAVDGGADAVFMAGPQFGARAKEANFDEPSLVEAVKYAHLYGVRVYITLNTLIKDDELPMVYSYIDWLYQNDIDALIIQDLACVAYVTSHYPDLPLHASTQMALHDKDGLYMAQKMGLSRVVVARETSLKEISDMIATETVDCEVFVHGALCYGYSGQCLLSSVQGGRSGNRGQCAQPCRKAYAVEGLTQDNQETFAMSMRDLSTLSGISELTKAGVASYKIEGRLRSADYVYHTVHAYRRALDGADSATLDHLSQNMYNAFNRDYTRGHVLEDHVRLNLDMASNKGEMVATTLGGSQFKLELDLTSPIEKGDGLKVMLSSDPKSQESKGIEVFNIYIQDPVTGEVATATQAEAGMQVAIDFNGLVPRGARVFRTRSAHLTKLRLQETAKKTLPITMDFEGKLGQVMQLTVRDGKFTVVVKSDAPLEAAAKRASTLEEVKENLSKLGGTAFHIDLFKADFEDGLFIPKSAVNALRRDAIDQLSALRMISYPNRALDQEEPKPEPKIEIETEGVGASDSVDLTIYVKTKEQALAARRALALHGGENSLSALIFTDQGALVSLDQEAIYPALSPFVKAKDQVTAACGLSQVVGASNLGHLHQFQGKEIFWGPASQVYNTAASAYLRTLGASDIIASPELTVNEARRLGQSGVRQLAYGKLAVMYTRTCPKKQAGVKCSDCSGRFKVSGGQGVDLVVSCDRDLLTYYTALPLVKEALWLSEPTIAKNRTGALGGPKLAIAFFDEAPNEVTTILKNIILRTPFDGERLSSYYRPVV